MSRKAFVFLLCALAMACGTAGPVMGQNKGEAADGGGGMAVDRRKMARARGP